MDQKYTQLFTELAHSAELIAEQVMEYNRKKNDNKGEQTAQIMRDDYAAFYDKLRADGYDFSTLDKKDYARILVGAFIIANNMSDQINNMQRILNGYQQDLIPKIQEIMAMPDTVTVEDIAAKANEIFQVSDDSNN